MRYETFITGALQTNSYLLLSDDSTQAVIIDPGDPIDRLINRIQEMQRTLQAVLITHAHFDHILGTKKIRQTWPQVPIYLHSGDLSLWKTGGGASLVGFPAEKLPLPDCTLEEQSGMAFSDICLSVLFTPGHTPGHVTFYAPALSAAFCGDLIFKNAVGRTDLPGGSQQQLMQSIHDRIFTLPDNTILCPGHGPITSVVKEKHNFSFR